MELKFPEKLRGVQKFLERWKYLLLLAAAGLLMLSFPVREKTDVPAAAFAEAETPELETQMEQILSQVEGAGRVRVMLTQRNGGVTTYQSAMVSSVGAPDYRGAVIVCEGAQSADVRLSLVRAVCSLTGLGSDRVTVLKMKTNQEESP